ncbi:MAG: MATE family efflux transporter [Myxococcota bacterium]
MSVTSLRVEAKVLARLAAPVVFGQVGLMALGVVDTLMVGHLGVAEELAGVALGNSWSWGLVVFALGASAGLDPALTQAHGARDGDAYDRAVAMGALLLAILCVPIVLGHLFTEVALGALGQPVEVLGLSGAYNRAIAWGVGPFIFFSLLRQGMQAREVMRPAVWAIALGNLVNVPANLFFIEGGFGWEGMGPVGVGWSTTIVRWTMFLAIAVTAGRERRGISRGLARTTDRLRRTWRLATTARAFRCWCVCWPAVH